MQRLLLAPPSAAPQSGAQRDLHCYCWGYSAAAVLTRVAVDVVAVVDSGSGSKARRAVG